MFKFLLSLLISPVLFMLALDGIVDHPVNPFTGLALTDAAKRAPEQRVALVKDYRPSTNNGATFRTLRWYANANRPGELSAWRRPEDGGTSP